MGKKGNINFTPSMYIVVYTYFLVKVTLTWLAPMRHAALSPVGIHYTVMRFLDLKETSTDMAADWIFEKFKLI